MKGKTIISKIILLDNAHKLNDTKGSAWRAENPIATVTSVGKAKRATSTPEWVEIFSTSPALFRLSSNYHGCYRGYWILTLSASFAKKY